MFCNRCILCCAPSRKSLTINDQTNTLLSEAVYMCEGNGWYHVNGNTYGTWLHGDRRGWRSRHGRDHPVGDYKTPPPAGMYDRLEEYSRRIRKAEPVLLTPACATGSDWRRNTPHISSASLVCPDRSGRESAGPCPSVIAPTKSTYSNTSSHIASRDRAYGRLGMVC